MHPTWRVSVIALIAVLVLAPAASSHPYFNSAEPGCDGSDPNVLLCDDFEDGVWYSLDCDQAGHPTQGNQDPFADNDGWCGAIGENPITPPNAAVCGGAGAAGTSCAASQGLHVGSTATASIAAGATTINVVSTSTFPSSNGGSNWHVGGASGANDCTNFNIHWTGKTATSLTGVSGITQPCNFTGAVVAKEGGRNMADHAFANFQGVDEIYVRYYRRTDPGYIWGAEKALTFNDGNPGDGGIKWGNFSFNCAAFPKTTGNPRMGIVGEGQCQDQNQGNDIFLQSGRWYFIEIHVKLNTVGSSNGVYRLWINDCGTDGLGCASPVTPILRASRSNVNWGKTNTGEHIRVLWWENWANLPSVGTNYIDQIKASKVGPIGFVGGVSPPAPPMAPSNLTVTP